ncbi:hypothetical protein N7508_001429 [Penicillium antarcticum]|uniref:uncharacterized protein n=1 Tax=Penicillium antarcticum TaxID=416450 RepID=UPI00238A96E3|nr:uncharacterized protein N7508_001429 [Penicillium antarcticum]KAJ5316921.1 hypothetical protein N7508_001429 [Penicillium antarcticum]
MFALRQASPFDLIYLPNRNLFSLLEWVTRRNRNKIIAFLLDQGTDPNSLFDPPFWSKVSYDGTEIKMESLIPSMRVLFRHIDISYKSDEEAAISHVCPSFYRLPKRIRIRVALRIGAFYIHNWSIPELFRVILGTDVLEPNDFKFCQELDSTLIHCAARGRGVSERGFREGTSADRSNCDAWGDLCHKFFCVRIDIYDLVDGKTPFLSFLDGYLSSWYGPIELGPACQIAVQVWLKQLEVVGVDLNRYGKAEEYMWKGGITQREFDVWNIPEQGFELQGMIGFTYGSSPGNWYIWLSEESDSFVGEFWDMIERPVEVMPGAWPKE